MSTNTDDDHPEVVILYAFLSIPVWITGIILIFF